MKDMCVYAIIEFQQRRCNKYSSEDSSSFFFSFLFFLIININEIIIFLSIHLIYFIQIVQLKKDHGFFFCHFHYIIE
jgi:hypothetical protein